MTVKTQITMIAVQATPEGDKPLKVLSEIVEICAALAAKADCAEDLAAVMAGEAALLRASPRDLNIVALQALAQQAARDVREGGEL